MALKPCPECGKEISDKAPTCPHCGVPQIIQPEAQPAASSASGQPSRTSKRRLWLSSVILGVLLVVLGFILWRVAQPALQTVGVVPAPKWFVENAGGDDSCTVVGDYCMRTKCLIRNVGDAPGAVEVKAVLHEDRGSTVEKTTVLRLTPGQSSTVTFDFFEAEMGKKYRYACSAASRR